MRKQKKSEQLGIPYGTACNRLRKSILFRMVQKLNLDVCSLCGKLIEDNKQFSIQHDTPWLDSESPIELFFDLDNISFAHLFCNGAAARHKKGLTHGKADTYRQGCRCSDCTEANRTKVAQYRMRQRETTV